MRAERIDPTWARAEQRAKTSNKMKRFISFCLTVCEPRADWLTVGQARSFPMKQPTGREGEPTPFCVPKLVIYFRTYPRLTGRSSRNWRVGNRLFTTLIPIRGSQGFVFAPMHVSKNFGANATKSGASPWPCSGFARHSECVELIDNSQWNKSNHHQMKAGAAPSSGWVMDNDHAMITAAHGLSQLQSSHQCAVCLTGGSMISNGEGSRARRWCGSSVLTHWAK
ncbi:hypothetical protein EVAR_57614_1 [Eumeta japonica]|uniref:Uncharacterized protein n=1 Tax=Eumeta variegata TaxID=151549 RepID=A0A4C1XXH2_EUMVA|nr:hypothetical protein EVAR_57614_1 [Eumeta japonica]